MSHIDILCQKSEIKLYREYKPVPHSIPINSTPTNYLNWSKITFRDSKIKI